MNKFYEAACAYAEAGRPVLPLKAGDKSPITPHGVKDATTNQDQIRKWWTQFPDANVGIAVGHEVFGLDIDYKDGADKDFLKRIPVTAIVKSPSGGHHAYFKLPEGGIKNGLVVEKGVTVRSSGYYFAAPPSFYTKTASTYEWDSKPIYSGEIAECPEWILEINNQVSEEKKAYKIPEQINEGERNTNFWKLACSLRAKGLEENEIVAGLIAANERTNPKVPLEELEDFAKRACGYEKGAGEGEDLDKKEEEIKECGGLHRYTLKKSLMELINSSNTDRKEKRLALNLLDRIFSTTKTPISLANALIKWAGFNNEKNEPLLRYYRNEFYRYKGTHYQKLDDEWLYDKINRFLIDEDWKQLAGTEFANKIFKILQIKPHYVGGQIELPAVNESPDWMGDWTATKNIIPLQNGVLDVKNEKLIEHSPRYFFNYSLPFSFDPKAKCPIFDKICQEIFSSPEEIMLFEEIMGVHIYNPFLLENMFMLYGQGANGKSVMTTILRCLLGEINVSSVPIDCFNASNFLFQDTLGKLANIIPDMKELNIMDEGALKAFISREEMHFNRKNKPAVKAKPTAFLTACTNTLPKFGDKTSGVWRRIVILEFKKQFRKEDQNPQYRDTAFWTASGELPGIFNKALAGAKRVEKRGWIIETEESKELVEEYRQELNHVSGFARECLEFGDYEVPSHPFYVAFKNMVIENGGRVPGAKTFFHQLRMEAKNMGHQVGVSKVNKKKDAYNGKWVTGARLNDYGEQLSVLNQKSYLD